MGSTAPQREKRKRGAAERTAPLISAPHARCAPSTVHGPWCMVYGMVTNLKGILRPETGLLGLKQWQSEGRSMGKSM